MPGPVRPGPGVMAASRSPASTSEVWGRFLCDQGLWAVLGPLWRLEFAAFSVKSMAMIWQGNGIGANGGAWRLFPALLLVLALLAPGLVSAQMFSDRPPPVPPG